MDEKALEKFDPTVEKLTAMVKVSAKISATDLEDPKQLAVVKENRIELKRARVQIEKTGKSLREEAIAFQRAVISKEKELIAIIEPEEDRLAAIEDEAKALTTRKMRLTQLPIRKERLSDITHKYGVEDEALLGMDEAEFEACFNSCVAYSNEREREIAEEAARAAQERIEQANEAKRKEQEAKDAELREREEKVGLAPLKWRGIVSADRAFFELCGAEVVERGMAPNGVVEAVDVAGNVACRVGAGEEGGSPDQLGFQRLEERLDHGVVVTVALARHRDADAVAAQLGLVIDRAVLAAAIGMVDQPLGRTPHGESGLQGSDRQPAVQAVADRPADDPPREQVDDDGEIDPALPCPHVGDVDAPLLVRAAGSKVLVDDVGGHWPAVLAVGGALEAALLARPEIVVAHQPRGSSPANGEAVVLQLARHPRAAIGAVRQRERRPGVREQHQIGLLPAAGRSILPGKIAARADAEQSAQTGDGECRFRLIDELELHRLPSRAKKAAAFFRMSRS